MPDEADISWPSFLVLLFIVWMLWVRVHETVRRFPPSCISLPVVGRIPAIMMRTLLTPGSNFYREFLRDGISKGDMWCTFLGMRRVIGLTSYDAVFQALSRRGKENSWRPRAMSFTDLPIDDSKSDDSTRAQWRKYRRSAAAIMRDLSVNSNFAERKIQIEAKFLNEEIKTVTSQPVCPDLILARSVSNAICQFVFGYRNGPDNNEFENFNNLLRKTITGEDVKIFIPLLFPALDNSFLFQLLEKSFRYYEREKKVIAFIENKVLEAEAQVTKGSDADLQHFVEAFLRKHRSGSMDSAFFRKQLIASVYDMFSAALETSATFLNRALIYLAVHRDWQMALQAEIAEELGTVNDISYVDRLRCHKTMAFIDEVQRHASILPLNARHVVSKERFFRGHRIPVGALILPDIDSVHYDPELWTEPRLFDPTRFLKNTGEYQPNRFLISFSIGKRDSPGDSLTGIIIFLFLSSLLRSFHVDFDGARKALKNDVLIGTDFNIHASKCQKLIFTVRER